MFTNNKFGKFDAVADAIKNIAEADYKAKMEELKGQQHKIDKNKNNKIDAHDFAILRGEKKGMKKEEAEQIDEISSTLANKYLNAPQGKGANKYKVGDTGTTKKNIYPDVETMSKHSKSVRQAIQRSGSSSIFKKPSYYKEEAEQIDEEINVKKDYDDHEQSEHGVYKGKRKIGYIVHNKKAGTHTAYHGHKYGKDDYENSDDFKSHEHALNQIKKSAGINESNNPFDLKNYKSQLPTKPGEKAGFDSKKVSTGTIYSRKPVKDEPMKKEDVEQTVAESDLSSPTLHWSPKLKDREDPGGKRTKLEPATGKYRVTSAGPEGAKHVKQQIKSRQQSGGIAGPKARLPEEIDPNDTTTDTLKGHEKTSGNPFLSKKVKMDVPDNVKEEAEQIDELKKATVKSYLAKKMASLPGKDPKKDQKDMMKAHHRVTGVKPTSEEVEQVDERTLTKGETKEKERIVKGMKKSLAGFKQRYGDKAKSVMYATATKAAKKD